MTHKTLCPLMLTFLIDGGVQDLASTHWVLGRLVLPSLQARQHGAAFGSRAGRILEESAGKAKDSHFFESDLQHHITVKQALLPPSQI